MDVAHSSATRASQACKLQAVADAACHDLVFPPVACSSEGEVLPPAYEVHKNNDDQVASYPAEYSEEEWQEVLRLTDDTRNRVKDFLDRPEDQFVTVDIGLDSAHGCTDIKFDLCTVANPTTSAHLFRMRACLKGGDPQEMQESLFQPGNAIHYSIMNWGTLILKEKGDIALVYSLITGFDSVVEDIMMIFHKFKHGNKFCVSYLTIDERVSQFNLSKHTPKRKGIRRCEDCISYIVFEKCGSGVQVEFAIERKEVESYNAEPQAMMLSLKGVLFYRFMLTYLSCLYHTSEKEMEELLASRNIVRHVVRAAAHLIHWDLMYATPDNQLYTSRDTLNDFMKMGSKALVTIKAPISRVMNEISNNVPKWLKSLGFFVSTIDREGDLQVFDITIPANKSGNGREMWSKVACTIYELTVNNYIIAFTSLKLSLTEKRDIMNRFEMLPSALFVHAMSEDSTFIVFNLVFNMNTLPFRLDLPNEKVKKQFRDFAEKMMDVYTGLKSQCEATAQVPFNPAQLAAQEFEAIKQMVVEGQQHFLECVNVLARQDARLKELYAELHAMTAEANVNMPAMSAAKSLSATSAVVTTTSHKRKRSARDVSNE